MGPFYLLAIWSMLVVSGVSSRGGRGQRGRGPRYQSEPRPIRHHRTVDRLDFLDAHNRVRANVTPPAANMLVMHWNAKLEQMASSWADGCELQRGGTGVSDRPFDWIGQNRNQRAVSKGYTADDVVGEWVNKADEEIKQMIWANSSHLGCAAAMCNPSDNRTTPFYNIVCNYGPGANLQVEQLYEVGEFCSRCPTSHPACIEKLCTSDLQYLTQRDIKPTTAVPSLSSTRDNKPEYWTTWILAITAIYYALYIK